jgi:hypothetical protein
MQLIKQIPYPRAAERDRRGQKYQKCKTCKTCKTSISEFLNSLTRDVGNLAYNTVVFTYVVNTWDIEDLKFIIRVSRLSGELGH